MKEPPRTPPTPHRPRWGLYLLLGALGLALGAALGYVVYAAHRIARYHEPLADAAMEVRLAVLEATLAATEALADDAPGALDPAWARIERAEGCLRALLDGGWCAGGRIEPAREPGVRAVAAEIFSDLEELRDLTRRWGRQGEEGHGAGEAHRAHHAEAAEILRATEDLEAHIRVAIARELERISTVRWILMFVGAALAGIATAAFVGFERRRAADLRRVDEARRRAEESEARYRVLLEASPHGVVELSPDGRVRFTNPAAVALVGYRPEEVEGEPFWSFLVDPDEIRDARERFEAALAGTRPPERLVLRCRRSDGAVILVQADWDVHPGPDGRPTGVVALLTDVTEQRRAQEALGEQRALLEAVLEALPAPVFYKDAEGRYRGCNRAFEEFLGLPRERIVGATVFDVAPEHLARVYRDADEDLLRRGGTQVYEAQVLDTRGDLRDVVFRKAVIPGIGGGPAGLVGAVVDLTDQKRTQAQLQELNDALAARIRELSVLHAAAEVFSRPGAPLGDTLASLAEVLRSGAAEPSAVRVTIRVGPTGATSGPPGQGRPLVRRPIRSSGRERGEVVVEAVGGGAEDPEFWAVVDHVAERLGEYVERHDAVREREALLRDLESKNRELEQFARTVSHDLKNPLITVRVFAGLLERSLAAGNTDQARQELGRIREAAEWAFGLLEELLHLARAGRAVAEPEEVGFAEVVDEALRVLGPAIRARGTEVRVAPELPRVRGDRRRLVQVVANLVSNAVKFMGDQPAPRVEIGWRPGREGPAFYVRDNGSGIDPAHGDQVFEVFRRLRTDVPGTGVGLALVRRIVEAHGGRVWVESEGEGKGATFWFTLPGGAG